MNLSELFLDTFKVLEDEASMPKMPELIDHHAKALSDKLKHGMSDEEIGKHIQDHLKELDDPSKVKVLAKALANKMSMPK